MAVNPIDEVDLSELLSDLTPEELAEVVRSMPIDEAESLLADLEGHALVKPRGPLEQAQLIDPLYRTRPHLQYLSDRLAAAVDDVSKGKNRFMLVSMPPRMGKSTICSVHLPTWVLATHPTWPIGLISHDPGLAVNWGRDIRGIVEENSKMLGIKLSRDAGAAAEWKITGGGGVLSRSVGQSITGRGFKMLIVDDAVKDFADAHSETKRNSLWNWWIANAMTRQNGPWLVVFIGTRWHRDDLLGRVLSPEYEGDPDQWEVIEFPAIAKDHDVLGRKPGQPLMSPLMEETEPEALARWSILKRSVGSYSWEALYQQSPSSPEGEVFSSEWWRFWTTNPAHVSRNDDGEPDGRVVLINPDADLATATWLDSWDMAFKATDSSDYVVGQRWAMHRAGRYLIHQHRARMTFTQTKSRMEDWSDRNSVVAPYSSRVHTRLVEDKANGTAILDALKEDISGLIPVNPTESKVARARAVSPDAESGNVYFPYPADPGNEWVTDLLSELRDFPNGAHDDQVDALTQALSRMRVSSGGTITNPNNVTAMSSRRRGQVALDAGRKYSAGVR